MTPQAFPYCSAQKKSHARHLLLWVANTDVWFGGSDALQSPPVAAPHAVPVAAHRPQLPAGRAQQNDLQLPRPRRGAERSLKCWDPPPPQFPGSSQRKLWRGGPRQPYPAADGPCGAPPGAALCLPDCSGVTPGGGEKCKCVFFYGFFCVFYFGKICAFPRFFIYISF